MFKICFNDLQASAKAWRLWGLLGWLEIRQRYARSAVGPFWLTISMAVMIGAIGTVYGTLFGQSLRNYLPFLATSVVAWALFSQSVNEGCVAYIGAASYIRQAATPKLIYVFQVVWRNIIIFLHNSIIVFALIGFFGVKSWATLLFVVPGLLLFMLNAVWIAMLCAIASARFRDLPQIIGALVQVTFYISPIIYRPDALRSYAWVVDFNPMTYLLDIVRSPLLGQMPMMKSWVICGLLALVGWTVAIAVTGRFLKRIPYWV